ncbi:MAG: plastocyanin/azurin family copper-binding protein [Solirubrobacterales bacterium]
MKKLSALLVLALASAALVACGGEDDETTPTTATDTSGAEAENGEKAGADGGATLEFEADPAGGLAYTTDEASAEAGKVKIEFNNPQPAAHDVAIEDSSGKEIAATEIITESSDSTTADLKPGEYTFYCTVPGHREAGMEGALTVR